MSEDTELNNVFEFSEDVSNATAPVPLPKRNYPAEVRGSKIADSASKPGKKNLELDLYVAPESYPADYQDGNPDGETLKFWRPLRDDAKGRFGMKKFNEALGVKSSAKVDANDYMGCTCTVEIDWRKDLEDNDQAYVKKVIARQ